MVVTKYSAMVVLLVASCAWGQTSTPSATALDANYNTHFDVSTKGTSAAALQAAFPTESASTSCNCVQTDTNEIETSSFGYVAGGIRQGGCTSNLDMNYNYQLQSDSLLWNEGQTLEYDCVGEKPRIFFNTVGRRGIKRAFTRVLYEGSNSGCTLTTCDYNVSPWCSNTTNPTVNPPGVVDFQPYSVWNIRKACADLFGAWNCAGFATGSNALSDLGKAVCTVLPAP